MLITKADIAAYADFTVNISDQNVTHRIVQAGLMDVAPVIGRENYEKLLALQPLPVEPPVVEPTEPVIIPLDEVPAEEIPIEEPLPVPVVDLHAFYQAVLPFWALSAYKRIIKFHGVQVDQSGLTVRRGHDFDQASDKLRGEILNSIRSDIHFYQSELEAYLRANNLLPKVDSCSEAPRKLNIGIATAKRRR
ncbi:DUF6712 family protein [Rufibacter latericius]|uniref:Uncharacterized protein n=1 Tax=Rufibacter latericius TaxID=2487040 RepID=A0A3M9MN73_9BACT|nr:hypothetical protein [Rufibacter latericius]RNI26637.1 hypothetical protein EFB08_11505 [Rufibacter latericius]